jgi:hypothetical protein
VLPGPKALIDQKNQECLMIGFILRLEAGFRNLCNDFGLALALLSVRLIMAYEYIDSGLEKLHGDNWFTDLVAQGKFPFPSALSLPMFPGFWQRGWNWAVASC